MIVEIAVVTVGVVACFAIADRRAERESKTARMLGVYGERLDEAARKVRESADAVGNFGTVLDQLQREQKHQGGRLTALEMQKGGMR